MRSRTNTPQPQESLAEYVKRIRTSLSLSQTELAVKAGIHLQSLGKIERGMTTKLNSKSQRGLSVALQVSSEYLDAVARSVAVGAPSERAVTLSQSLIALLKPIFSVELAASLLFNEIQQIN